MSENEYKGTVELANIFFYSTFTKWHSIQIPNGKYICTAMKLREKIYQLEVDLERTIL